MKVWKVAIVALVLLFAIVSTSLGEESTIDLAGYTESYQPWLVMIDARDPLGQMEGIVHYEADPLENDPGEMNDTTVCLNTVYELFGKIQPLQAVEESDYPEASHLRFSIEYLLNRDGDMRTIKLDFYDYSDAVGITVFDSDDPSENIVFEGFGLMEHADSATLEALYLNRVASLQRVYDWENKEELVP